MSTSHSLTPRVSILVPVYNVESYLRQSIDSILMQSYSDFELILIDDGSTDGSSRILDEYKAKDARIIVVHKANEGVARTLNLALEISRGELIRRFDSDDTCLPEALEQQVQFIDDHPEVAMVSTQMSYQTNHGKIAFNHRMPRNPYFEGQPYRLVSPKDFYSYSPIVHGTVMLKRSILDEMGAYRTDFLTSEDNDLWLRICEKHQIAVLNTCTYFLRLHSTSATQRHASSLKFYRNLALRFHEERLLKGSDPLQRGETMPLPPEDGVFCQREEPKASEQIFPKGLSFIYPLMVDARDWRNVLALSKKALSSGWRSKETYKLLLFPLLGKRIVRGGVKIKAILRVGRLS